MRKLLKSSVTQDGHTPVLSGIAIAFLKQQ